MVDEGNTSAQHLLATPGLSAEPKPSLDLSLDLYGSGRNLWNQEHADEYVARLRGGWE